jgi:hypothetical protein
MTTAFNAHYGSLSSLHPFLSFPNPEIMVRLLLTAADLIVDPRAEAHPHMDALRAAFAANPLYVDQTRPVAWSINVAPGHAVDTDTLLRGIKEIPKPDRVAALLAHLQHWANGEHPDHITPLAAGAPRDN